MWKDLFFAQMWTNAEAILVSTEERVRIKSTATTVPAYQDTMGQDVKQVSQRWIKTILLSITVIFRFCEFKGCVIKHRDFFFICEFSGCSIIFL